MSSHIDDFEQPTIRKLHKTATGIEILVSARFSPQDNSNIVVNIDPSASDSSKHFEVVGKLLVEARDPNDPEEVRIGHCIFKTARDGISLVDAEVTYAFRCNKVGQTLTDFAMEITGLAAHGFTDQSFRYL